MAALAAFAGIMRYWPRKAGRRLAPTWTCGMTPTSRFDYTATAFAKPLRLIFAAVYQPRREIAKETGASPYVLNRLSYTGEVQDLAETMFYARLKLWITQAAHAIRVRSTGRTHGYIAFVLVTLVVTLILFARV
jgi:hydrogenase-4 component B